MVVLVKRKTMMKSLVFWVRFLFVVSALTVSATPINLMKNSVRSKEIGEDEKLLRNTRSRKINIPTEMNAYNYLQQFIGYFIWKPVPETCRWETKTKCVDVQWRGEEKRLCRIIQVKKCRKIS